MGEEDNLTALILGAIGGLLMFVVILMSTRGRLGFSAPGGSGPAAPGEDRYSSPSRATPAESRLSLHLRALLALDRIYLLLGRLFVIAAVLYGLVVAPRLRWVALGAGSSFTGFYLIGRRIARWAGRSSASK